MGRQFSPDYERSAEAGWKIKGKKNQAKNKSIYK